MTRSRLLASVIAVGGLVGLTLSAGMPAMAAGDPTGAPQMMHPAAAPASSMQMQETQMMEAHQKMMASMQASDDTLDALVTKMNGAKGQAKVDATAALLTTIVQQRASMRNEMIGMQDSMMEHMMQHMSEGMSPEAKKAIADCPLMKMMKQMGGIK